jgi:hypothetical protein
MDQQLPPPALVTTWLEIIHSRDMPQDIVNKRTKSLCYYFGSLELAYMYLEQNRFDQNKAS